MQLSVRGPSNVVAIGLGVLALVVAGSGAAVAVAASVVNIADPTTPANVAHVDSTGRLQVGLSSVAATSTIVSTGTFNNLGTTIVTSPTTTTLVLTGFEVTETRLNGTAVGSDLDVHLVQTAATSATACSTTVVRNLYITSLSSGLAVDPSGSARLAVKPVSGALYCLAIQSAILNGSSDVTPYYPVYSLTAYATGTYTGVGSSARPVAAAGLVRKPVVSARR